MLGTDPVKRGLNGYTYCDNDLTMDELNENTNPPAMLGRIE